MTLISSKKQNKLEKLLKQCKIKYKEYYNVKTFYTKLLLVYIFPHEITPYDKALLIKITKNNYTYYTKLNVVCFGI